MIINETGAEYVYENTIFRIEEPIFVTGEGGEYQGLTGIITEIRDGEDKETDKEGPDLYCSFDLPVLPADIKELEDTFSCLHGVPTKLEDIGLDMVIMSPEMVRPLVCADNPNVTVYVIEEEWAVSGAYGSRASVFSNPVVANASLNRILGREMKEGIISSWIGSDAFKVETDEWSYECWIEGERETNHYSISFTTCKMAVDNSVFGNIGRAFIDKSQCEDLIAMLDSSIDQTVDPEIREKIHRMALMDERIPEMIQSNLMNNAYFWDSYWETISVTVEELIAECQIKE